MTIATGNSIQDFVKSLGLDPSKTRHIVIDIPANGVVMVYVSMYAQKEDLEVITPFRPKDIHIAQVEKIDYDKPTGA